MQWLLAYNDDPGDNPLGLLPAFELYENHIYRALASRFGAEKTYIVSAGWGLINAAFLTPSYDITFNASAENLVCRLKGDSYHDSCMLPDNTEEPVVFFGSKQSVPFFAALTRAVKGQRTIFYNSKQAPSASGCVLRRYETHIPQEIDDLLDVRFERHSN